MKCDYIYLKNLENLFVGMQINKLEIDFDNENIFNLLAGSNGSGKSTLLNAIDPLHVENIRDGKKGQKKLIFTDNINDRQYIVKHIYEPKGKAGELKGHSVKRFFTLIDNKGNEKELNENGNVSTFNELVELYLGLSQANLKILKLGNDMVSFIKLSTTERKKYMTLFIKDTELYLSWYKKINGDSILVHKMFKNYADKLNELDSLDKIKKQEKQISEELNKCDKGIVTLNAKISNNKLKIDELNVPNDLGKQIEELSNKYKKNIKIKEKMEQKFGDILNKDISNITDMYKTLINNKDNYEDKNKSLSIIIDNLDKSIYDYTSKINNINLELLSYDTDYDKADFDTEIKKCNDYLKSHFDIYNTFKDYADIISENNLITIMNYFNNKKNEMEACAEQLDFDTISLFNINNDYKTLYINSLNNISNLNATINLKEKELDTINNTMKGFTCNNTDCPLLKKYFSGSSNKEIIENELSVSNSMLNKEKSLSEKYFSLNTLKSICLELLNYIKSLHPFLIKTFSLDEKSILKKINNNSFNLLKQNKVQEYINISNIIKEYSSKSEYLNKLIIMKKEYDMYKKLYDDKNKYEKQLSLYKDEKNKYLETIENNNNSISELNDNIEAMSYVIANKKDFDDLDETINKYNNLLDIRNKYQDYLADNFKIKLDLEKLNNYKKDLSKDRDNLIFQKNYIKDLIKRKKLFEENYNDLVILKDALGPKKGIPLIFVSSYLQKTKDIANEILIDAFDGEIVFDKFDINDKEFNIPLIKNGERIPDISRASAGERAIGSLALTFALMEQTNTKFNILLLDEFDGPLDKKRKRLFLHLLEKRIKKYGIEQIFIITHNSIFDDYPLNLILFKGADVNTSGDKEILFEY